MKKVFLLTALCSLFVIGCNTDEKMETYLGQENLNLQQKEKYIEDTSLRLKVANAFNQMVQSEEVWLSLKTIIQDDIAMRKGKDYVVIEDNIIMRSDEVTEDHVMFLNASILKDDVLPRVKVTF